MRLTVQQHYDNDTILDWICLESVNQSSSPTRL